MQAKPGFKRAATPPYESSESPRPAPTPSRMPIGPRG
jgi:hypothetical protein